MIKGIIKTLLTVILVLILGILYLSIFGLKTDKFNNQIKKSISEVNSKINFQINDRKSKRSRITSNCY